MNPARRFLPLVLLALLGVAGCATRPINPPIAQYVPAQQSFGERLDQANRGSKENLVFLAFSGGGTRAAAFSYGVLEALRRIEVVTRAGEKIRLLDQVDVITGISGGSFTALAYGLYGEKLFDDYDTRFLKRDVQGELIARVLNPLNWGDLSSTGWGRSELAANLYDEILFNGATFADLWRAGGPQIGIGTTELATGSRIVFSQQNFDVMCAGLSTFSLARAAAASSAVPIVLSPLTINNYGGTCGYRVPPWLEQFADAANPLRPAGRMVKRIYEMQELGNSVKDPYFHLVDGAVSDNLGLRGVLDFLELFEALRASGQPTPLDQVRRILVFVVNAAASPRNDWSASENPPGTLAIAIQASGVPVDRYASESIELLKDIDARWATLREIRDSPEFANVKDPKLKTAVDAPNAKIYPIEVSFAALKDKAERDYLNQLPTSFALSGEAVDRLRAAAMTIILESPEFQQRLKDVGARIVDRPTTTPFEKPSSATTLPAPAAAK